ncbi:MULTISPECIES: hypothetical protein [Paracoccus]|uniref:hypothetical protein n=1 Tax=Paracoccus TaxID=265 RepID=UPI001FB6F89C|nr:MULTISPECIES: hypothetical protein [Paracoccus]MCJ1899767.1 hypothetical protein [Paracoccus versutus]MDF3904061.1 hypothetical protein [Paracoccus sp. AS002]
MNRRLDWEKANQDKKMQNQGCEFADGRKFTEKQQQALEEGRKKQTAARQRRHSQHNKSLAAKLLAESASHSEVHGRALESIYDALTPEEKINPQKGGWILKKINEVNPQVAAKTKAKRGRKRV